ncbi:peptidoglycan DD-metalloendopeptidase family protein [Emticicia sp. CRIBPO]|uniref:M23 family metallopeptidase n=1 Tax=Emticicia sp. CRIBPO TaxID=2683258 RepID=UPI001412DB41|nr:M23 family metallopeptidase [Emticicia sp. CRIBPO]NBA85483.1 peptidoglycan DD-metalloendopeptidase family protein [Emticicia sp. CRIBPO]
MKNLILIFCLVGCVGTGAWAQKEKGKIVKTPKIPAGKTNSKDQKSTGEAKSEFDFTFEEEPKLRFANSFENQNQKVQGNGKTDPNAKGGDVIKIEPIKQLNKTIHEDTSSIDEGELTIVEIEEEAQFQGSDEMVKIASYFSVWDTRSINPYGINPKEFEDVVNLKLYDISEGRNWASPLDKTRLTSHFGWRWRRWHKGTDIDLETGDPVYAAFDGIVRISGSHSGFGRTVMIRHYNGLETLYGHLSKINFEPNTIVKAGDEIGKGGNTGRSSGSHLHFETRYEGNPFDAENIYDFKNNDKAQIKFQEFILTSKVYDYLRGGASRPVATTDPNQAEFDEGEEEEEAPKYVEKKVWHRVKSGQNLTEIARKYGTSISEICRLNKISSYKKLYVGLRLRVK